MSKFIDNIKAEMTGKRYHDLEPISLLDVESTVTRVPYQELLEYVIGVTYGMHVFCRPEDLSDAKERVVNALREEIYGEFRKKAIALRLAMCRNSRREEITQKLDELMREVLG